MERPRAVGRRTFVPKRGGDFEGEGGQEVAERRGEEHQMACGPDVVLGGVSVGRGGDDDGDVPAKWP